jgi:hypothetical protein
LKFSRITFTHPRSVKFLGEDGRPHSSFAHDIGSLSTLENAVAPAVDSIEAVDSWIVVRYLGQVKAVPASAIEAADVLDGSEELLTAEEALAAMAPKRGPGRPTNASKAAEGGAV